MNSNYSKIDIFYFFMLFTGAVITVYFLPKNFAFFYFGYLLIQFWRTKKNSFWFILIFFLIDPPAGLFPEDYNYGLPFIKGINLRFIEIFIYVAFLKSVYQKIRFHSLFSKSFKLLFLLTILLLVYTFFLNTPLIDIIITLKWLFVWSLIYSIPKLISTYDEWVFLFRISFIVVFIAFFSQLFQLILGYSPSYLLGTNFSPMMDYGMGDFVLSKMDTNAYDLMVARPISSSYIIIIALMGSMFFQQFKKNIFPKVYLYFIMIFSYISILLTATRGWFIAFSVVLFLYFTLIQKTRKILTITILIIILISLLFKVPFLQKQFIGSFSRLSTIESVAEGDLSAGGTNARYRYSIELINIWKDSPVLGWGFSKVYKENQNGHAGLANMLFSVGIAGYLVFIYFWYSLFYIPYTVNKRISPGNPFKGSLIIFSLGFLIIFILNATSGQQFGIYLGFGGSVYSQILYYSYSSFFMIKAMNTEKTIGHLQNE